MAGPAPLYRPTFTAEQVAECARLARRPSTPHAIVYRAKLALPLHAEPALDNPTAERRVGKHQNWVRYWRRIWATEGFRLGDKAGRGRKPAFPPGGGGDREGAGLRGAGDARRATRRWAATARRSWPA